MIEVRNVSGNTLKELLYACSKKAIAGALNHFKGDVTASALFLGVNRLNLYKLMKKYDIGLATGRKG